MYSESALFDQTNKKCSKTVLYFSYTFQFYLSNFFFFFFFVQRFTKEGEVQALQWSPTVVQPHWLWLITHDHLHHSMSVYSIQCTTLFISKRAVSFRRACEWKKNNKIKRKATTRAWIHRYDNIIMYKQQDEREATTRAKIYRYSFVSQLIGVLSPVIHKGLYQGWHRYNNVIM